MFYFDKTIYNELYDTKFRFPTLLYLPKEFDGNIKNYLNNCLTEEQINILSGIIGSDSGIYYYDLIIE